MRGEEQCGGRRVRGISAGEESVGKEGVGNNCGGRECTEGGCGELVRGKRV